MSEERQQPAAEPELEGPAIVPLEAHIVALRAQLAHHERIVLLATAAALVGALALLVGSRAGVSK